MNYSVSVLISMHIVYCCNAYDSDKTHFSAFSDVSPFRTLSRVSLSRCVYECKTRLQCDVIEYSTTGKECSLIKENSTVTVERRPGRVGGRKGDWDMTYYSPCQQCGEAEVCGISVNGSVTCRKDECGFPETVPHTTYSGNIYTVGAKICYTCENGYVNTGGDVNCSTCSQTGIWTPVNIQCQQPVVCEGSWVEYGEHCYLQNTHRNSWQDARIQCRSHGGYLLSIETADENDFIEETFPNGEYWIGGNDYAVDGVFVWDSGKAITFKNWEPGEPDNFYFISYCMKANSHWRWHDYPCLTLYESICEKDPTHNASARITTDPTAEHSTTTTATTKDPSETTTSSTATTSTTYINVPSDTTTTSTVTTITTTSFTTTTTTSPDLYGHLEYRPNRKKTLVRAQKFCESGSRGSLATINDATDYDRIISFLKEQTYEERKNKILATVQRPTFSEYSELTFRPYTNTIPFFFNHQRRWDLKLQVMVFFVLLQNDMTIKINGHAANVSNNVFRWQQHAHREKIDPLKGNSVPNPVWIGLYYDKSDDEFKWLSDDSVATYFDWKPGSPESLPPDGDKMYVKIELSHFQYESAPGSDEYDFICED